MYGFLLDCWCEGFLKIDVMLFEFVFYNFGFVVGRVVVVMRFNFVYLLS